MFRLVLDREGPKLPDIPALIQQWAQTVSSMLVGTPEITYDFQTSSLMLGSTHIATVRAENDSARIVLAGHVGVVVGIAGTAFVMATNFAYRISSSSQDEPTVPAMTPATQTTYVAPTVATTSVMQPVANTMPSTSDDKIVAKLEFKYINSKLQLAEHPITYTISKNGTNLTSNTIMSKVGNSTQAELAGIIGVMRELGVQRISTFKMILSNEVTHSTLTKGWYRNWPARNWMSSTGSPVQNRQLWEQIMVLLPNFSSIEWVCEKNQSVQNVAGAQAGPLSFRGTQQLQNALQVQPIQMMPMPAPPPSSTKPLVFGHIINPRPEDL